jgi:hypothetical protein
MIYEIAAGALVLVTLPNLRSYVATRDALKILGDTPEEMRSQMESKPQPWYFKPFLYPGTKLALKHYERSE